MSKSPAKSFPLFVFRLDIQAEYSYLVLNTLTQPCYSSVGKVGMCIVGLSYLIFNDIRVVILRAFHYSCFLWILSSLPPTFLLMCS